MASKERLEVQITAKDDASKKLEGVVDEAEKLENADPEVKATAKDDASAELKEITSLADDFDGRTAQAKLKVEERRAKADLRAFQRQLADVDNEVTEAEVLADIGSAERKLNAIEGELEKLDRTRVEPEVDIPDAGGMGSKLGDLFGKSFIGGMGAAGIATAFVEAIDAGLERMQLRAKFSQRFGFVKADAEKYGKEAAALYRDGWGESLEEVMGALGAIDQQLVDTKQIAKDETDEIAEAALAMADVFGVDVDTVIRGVGQLMKNGMAPTAIEAMDSVIVALQEGGDQAGDFWDTIDEYSQHFGALGLSANDMFAIIKAGFDGGQRDSDKLADAIKELRLITNTESDEIAAAFDRIGLKQEDVQAAFAKGGDTARDAFIRIVDGLTEVRDGTEREQLGATLLGAMYEDLGPKGVEAFSAIKGAATDATGATQGLVDEMGEATSEWETFKRGYQDFDMAVTEKVAGGVNKVAGAAKSAAGWVTGLFDSGDDELSGRVETTAEAVEGLAGSAGDAALQSIDLALAQEGAQVATENQTEATEEAEKATEDYREELEDQIDTLEEEAAALQESARALEDKIDASRSAADATYALHDAEDDHADAVAEATKVLGNNKSTLREQRQALDNVAQTAQGTADAELRLAEETARANGQTLTATQRQDQLNGSLIRQAGQLNGPQRKALLDHIGRVNNIPAKKMSEIRAAIERGDLREAERLLNNTSRTRKSAVQQDANVKAAEGKLNNAARHRSTWVQGDSNAGQINADLDYATRDRMMTVKAQAQNLPFVGQVVGIGLARGSGGAPGGPTLVGEQGPEIVNLERGDTVATNEKTKRAMRGRSGGTTTIINHFPPGTRPDDVARSLRRYNDIQGPL